MLIDFQIFEQCEQCTNYKMFLSETIFDCLFLKYAVIKNMKLMRWSYYPISFFKLKTCFDVNCFAKLVNCLSEIVY